MIPIIPRLVGTKYFIEHNNGYFYVQTNLNAPNFEWYKTLDFKNKSILLEHASDKFLQRIEMFANFALIWYRNNVGSPRFGIWNFYTDSFLDQLEHIFPQSSFSVQPSFGDMESKIIRSFESDCFFFVNSSLVQPPSLYVFDARKLTANGIIVPTLSDPYLKSYTQIHTLVPSNNVHVPIDIFRPSSLAPRPTLLIAYGAYGSFIDPKYDPEMIPFLYKNYVVAICHPRGDGDLGAEWYEHGKYDKKENTFIDVQTCAKALIEYGISDPKSLIFKGRSAGGLVSGSAMNWKYEGSSLFKVIVAHVPFVDPTYDMHKAHVPWTPYEWFEWGNPNDDKILQAMLKYSPYLNMDSSSPPALYVSSGLEDSRVPFWEPIKYVAKWRSLGHDRIMLRVNKGGHFISSIHESAEWIAFVVDIIEQREMIRFQNQQRLE